MKRSHLAILGFYALAFLSLAVYGTLHASH